MYICCVCVRKEEIHVASSPSNKKIYLLRNKLQLTIYTCLLNTLLNKIIVIYIYGMRGVLDIYVNLLEGHQFVLIRL